MAKKNPKAYAEIIHGKRVRSACLITAKHSKWPEPYYEPCPNWCTIQWVIKKVSTKHLLQFAYPLVLAKLAISTPPPLFFRLLRFSCAIVQFCMKEQLFAEEVWVNATKIPGSLVHLAPRPSDRPVALASLCESLTNKRHSCAVKKVLHSTKVKGFATLHCSVSFFFLLWHLLTPSCGTLKKGSCWWLKKMRVL